MYTIVQKYSKIFLHFYLLISSKPNSHKSLVISLKTLFFKHRSPHAFEFCYSLEDKLKTTQMLSKKTTAAAVN